MKTINYYNLEDITEAAQEHGVDLNTTLHSTSFRIFKGKQCTELHILQNYRPREITGSAAPHGMIQKAVTPVFTYNDGGRFAAGYKGDAGDCVCRSICIATGRPYKEVYDHLAQNNFEQKRAKGSQSKRPRSAARGINTARKWFKDYMTELGFVWVPTMFIGSGCKVHLKAGELPKGRLVVAVSKHFTTMIDGVIHDTWNPQRETGRCVYGYFKLSTDRFP